MRRRRAGGGQPRSAQRRTSRHRPRSSRAGFSDPTLVLRWEEIAGSETARLAQPIKLSESASGGVLTLRAEPGAALFLQHDSRALCERINAYLGRTAVSRLRFVQGRVDPHGTSSLPSACKRPGARRRPGPEI